MKRLAASVVIINCNCEKLLEKNLPLIINAKDNLDNNIVEIIVVDDFSSDKSVRVVGAKFPQVKLIKHKIRRGYPASLNTGARTAKADLIVFLSPDAVPQKNFLTSVYKHFENEKVFSVSMHEKENAHIKASFSAGYVQLSTGEEVKTSHNSFCVNSKYGIFRRNIWMELGGMDENIFSISKWCDIDICYRSEKRGFINMWEPASMIYCDKEFSAELLTMANPKVEERDRLLMVWKNIHSPKLIRNHIIGMIRRTAKHPEYILIILMALGKIDVVLKARKKEMKFDTVSDEAVFMQYK